jgi:hypothetical protein
MASFGSSCSRWMARARSLGSPETKDSKQPGGKVSSTERVGDTTIGMPHRDVVEHLARERGEEKRLGQRPCRLSGRNIMLIFEKSSA